LIQLALLHFAVAGTIASEYDMKQLATVHVAGCWMRRESNESYKWAMKQFRPTAWANVMDPSLLPNNSVTGKDLALMNAFKQVFSESKHILCYVHIMYNFLQRLIKNMTKKAKLGEYPLGLKMSTSTKNAQKHYIK